MQPIFKQCFGAAIAFSIWTPSVALAQSGISLNYDTLSSLEEPLAVEVGDVTFNLTGLVDAPLSFGLSGIEDDFEAGFIGNAQISAQTQLWNRWRVGAAYFGQYETDPEIFGRPGGGDYTFRAAGFLSGAWGMLSVGKVTGMVREETRRVRGTGNAALAFDNSIGILRKFGGGYTGQFGPTRLSAVVDQAGNVDVGASWSRPIANKDYRFALRLMRGEVKDDDANARFQSHAANAVGEFIYGSGLYDIGVGYERLGGEELSADRWYTSAGARWKNDALTLSLEGHYGQIDGDPETSAAFGARYDIARGASVNLGVNYSDAELRVGNFTVEDTDDETRGIFSLRYDF